MYLYISLSYLNINIFTDILKISHQQLIGENLELLIGRGI